MTDSIAEITFAQAINRALKDAMVEDDSVICYGLGADDPLRIFSTTKDLVELYPERVFDMPTSENGMTGVGIGAALNGLRPVMTHQRLDFFLLAMDQLVNAAAKWHFMFDAKSTVPIVIRLIIGRGWGQGPTHSQHLHAWFAHIPGLKVIIPTSVNDAYHLLKQSIKDNNPVVFIEHRWLHNQKGSIDTNHKSTLSQAAVVKQGTELTLVSSSYLTVEAIRACEFLEQHDVSVELIDLRTVNPIDWPTIYTSVAKTKRVLVIDAGARTGSISGEIVAQVSEMLFDQLLAAPARMAMPDIPEPTSYSLTKDFYFGAKEIVEKIMTMLGIDIDPTQVDSLNVQGHHDIPGEYFKGPF
ncbi:hypothetical protein N7931_03705 [Catenovulum sp. 2E275]|uniref:alpha-ketoacid dehydrogenase subunit beta n=1 Tax=Catenovulum sp. 2E275 TaxID=2980497 RepID=UPI0021CE2308|nr:transketolase C-terminal domain-containing protein [Catenovulum sp. 2E275]MCU4674732.1 hypothetical protein [Catenovulum sp. 2E275]